MLISSGVISNEISPPIPALISANGNFMSPSIDLPSNVLKFTFENGDTMVVRPSGTEPKLKLYIGAHADTDKAVEDKLTALMDGMDARLSELLGL